MRCFGLYGIALALHHPADPVAHLIFIQAFTFKNNPVFGDVLINPLTFVELLVFVAKNQNGRDFRLWQEGELWQKINIQKSNDNNYQVEIKDKSNGYEAIMMEFTIDPESEFPLIISSGPFVIPESYPFNKYEPLK